MATRDVNDKLLKTKPPVSLDRLISGYMLLNKKVNKRSFKCEEFRESADKAMAAKKPLTALILHNKSLCFAKKNTYDSGTTFLNRCEVCFFFIAVTESQKNLDFAKAHSIPQPLISLAKNYELATTEWLKPKKSKRSNLNAKFEFERETNTPHVDVFDNLIIKQGHLITTKAFKIGDIIAVEHPFFGATLKASSYINCANCLKFLIFTLIPCDGCTTSNICDFTIIP